jgi:hypothetical protein
MKENENTHIVQKFQLDLTVDKQEESRKILESASEMVNSKIIPLTEDIMDKWADENTHVSLDRLEIDLGAIPLDNFRDLFFDAYEKKIKESLSKLLDQEKMGQPVHITKKTQRQALLEQFIFFLKEGWVSWEFQETAAFGADDILLKLLKENQDGLKAQLRPLLAVDRVVDRLVNSLQPDTLDLLLAELAFSDAATQAMMLIGELSRFNHMKHLKLTRKQIEMAVYRQAFKMAAHNEIIFSGKTISRIFYDLLTALNIQQQQFTGYVKQFGNFVKKEKFLSQFVGLIDDLKKNGSSGISEKASARKIEDRFLNETEEKAAQDENEMIGIEPTDKEFLCNLNNAGLILGYPYLKTIFGRFNWLNEKGMINPDYQTKALLLTDYLVYGEREVVPEHELVLNKVLCGVEPKVSLAPLAVLSSEEKLEADDLLKSAVKHWSVLKDTSMEGYRSSFLQRDGILKFEDDNWYLRVERKSYDMLMESLPFTISLIRLPWMKYKLLVEW